MGAIRQQDKAVFADAARHFNFWILVRRTNRESLPYIGLPNYTPKPMDCKAKTADTNYDSRYRMAGLVVNPNEHRRAFGARLADALSQWKKFQDVLRDPTSGYSVDRDTKSLHFGCVTLCRADTGGVRKYIHGDYDLYDIVDANNVRVNLAIVETLHNQRHMRAPHFERVMQYVNSRIGVPMVQHSGQVQFAAHSDEPVDVFGPQGEDCTLLNEFSIRGWYKNRFEGRRTMVEKWGPYQSN
jgi:hypothetical protein